MELHGKKAHCTNNDVSGANVSFIDFLSPFDNMFFNVL